MSVVIGIDVGGSTTKIVGYTAMREQIGMLKVEAADPVTSAYGALGRFINDNNLSLSEVEHIILTGVGAALLSKDIYGIPTLCVDEFEAIGLGGLALSGKKDGLIVSMGTGTAFVRAGKEGITHIGGAGIGGGKNVGLGAKLCGVKNFRSIVELAEKGNLEKVDLNIKDISTAVISTLSPDITASNFGKMEDGFSSADLAAGLINLVFQTIGMLSVFACRNEKVKDVVLTGTLTQVKDVRKVFDMLRQMHGVNFIIPQHAIYATACGAALSYLNKKK